jgi:hypothetical protein
LQNEFSRHFAKICSYSLNFRFSRKLKNRFCFNPIAVIGRIGPKVYFHFFKRQQHVISYL